MNDVCTNADTFEKLKFRVIDEGLCTHCGTCVGLSDGALTMVDSPCGPLPHAAREAGITLPPAAWEACPGRGLAYPELCNATFGALPDNWLIGCCRELFVGHASDQEIRRDGASGGVITQVLLHLLAEGVIDGAVVVRQGWPEPWQASPVIARTAEEIRACAQSVYVPVGVNTILGAMAEFPGRLAYVGLPDQVAALRRLQALGHPGANRVDYVVGPYVGTLIYQGAIESYLRANGVTSLQEVVDLRYREGEWPGHLRIQTKSGRILKVEKFYYNYLIPFYITQSSLFSVDFTNELTDISVGDAWHPKYESQKQGFSVVVGRSERGTSLLREMEERKLLDLQPIELDEALSMHGHMLDFKKRGAFIRIDRRRAAGRYAPDYGYCPDHIRFSRRAVETVLNLIFSSCRISWVRRMAERVPLAIMGPVFNALRIGWKTLSKPTKRKGLAGLEFNVSTET